MLLGYMKSGYVTVAERSIKYAKRTEYSKQMVSRRDGRAPGDQGRPDSNASLHELVASMFNCLLQ
jgi:hypothetical protein